MRFFGRFFAACVVLASLAACTMDAAPEVVEDDMVQAEPTIQPQDLIDLKVYFRQRDGRDAHLKPVLREVPVSEDLPRTALALLLEGPTETDPPGLKAPLPTSSRVTRFSVRNGEARVELSRSAVTDVAPKHKRPVDEVLALAAVTNTLTEFPDIRRVRLRIKGQTSRRFWGGWGVPKVLVRDESLISPQSKVALPPLHGFDRRPRRIGMERRRRPVPKVAAVRIQSLTTYLRVTVEVTGGKGRSLKGPVPPAQARRDGKKIVLRVQGNPAKKVGGRLAGSVRDPALRGGRVDVTKGRPRQVVVRLRSHRPAKFLLHTLSEPARVVLDIQR